MLSCRFADSKVRWTSPVLWMAVVSESSVKSSRRNSASSSVGANQFIENSLPRSQPLFRTVGRVNSKVRWTSLVLCTAVVNQSSVNSSRRNSASSSMGANPFLKKRLTAITFPISSVC